MGVYRNKRTGLTLETSCQITGEDWEAVAPVSKPKTPKKAPEKEKKEPRG